MVGELPWFIVGLEAEARLLTRQSARVCVGGGTAEGARAAARKALRAGAPALISFGLAGGLDPDLAAGAVVVPSCVMDGALSFAADRRLLGRLGEASHRAVLASGVIVAEAAEKARLWAATGAASVDLESGPVAMEAATARRSFAVLRVVCDAATRSLPPAARVPLVTGRVDLAGVLASLLLQPSQLPSLLALARDAAISRRALRVCASQVP